MTFRRASAACLLLFAPACARAPKTAPVVITHVSVVDAERGVLLADRTVFIADGRVERVDSAPTFKVPSGTQIVDGKGRFLIPGLWDMHVHSDGDARIARQLLGWGITGARDMSSELDPVLALRRDQRSRAVEGPRFVIAGPLLRGPRSATDTAISLDFVRTEDDAIRAVDSLASRGVDFIKVHEGLSEAAWFAIARRARERGMPFVGHVPATLTPLEVADSGIRSIEHLEFLPDRCLVLFDPAARARRAAPPAGCQRAEIDALLQHLHGAGVWLDPTIGSFRVFAKAQWPAILGGFGDLVPAIRRSSLPMLTGTDLGSANIVPGESLHDEFALLVQAGFTSAEVLRFATWNPPLFLAISDSVGAVRPGYVADLLLLEANPLADIRNTRRLAAAIIGGKLITGPELARLRR